MVGKFLLSFILTLCIGGILSVKAQSFTYTYYNSCLQRNETIQIPIGGSVTINFLGRFRTFTQAEMENGELERWREGIISSLPPGTDPCASERGQAASGACDL